MMIFDDDGGDDDDDDADADADADDAGRCDDDDDDEDEDEDEDEAITWLEDKKWIWMFESLRLGHGCLSLRCQWSDDVRGCDRGAGRQRWHLRGEIAVCCVGLLS